MGEEEYFESSSGGFGKLILENTPTFVVSNLSINDREVSKYKSPNRLNLFFYSQWSWSLFWNVFSCMLLNIPIFYLWKRKKPILCYFLRKRREKKRDYFGFIPIVSQTISHTVCLCCCWYEHGAVPCVMSRKLSSLICCAGQNYIS